MPVNNGRQANIRDNRRFLTLAAATPQSSKLYRAATKRWPGRAENGYPLV